MRSELNPYQPDQPTSSHLTPFFFHEKCQYFHFIDWLIISLCFVYITSRGIPITYMRMTEGLLFLIGKCQLLVLLEGEGNVSFRDRTRDLLLKSPSTPLSSLIELPSGTKVSFTMVMGTTLDNIIAKLLCMDQFILFGFIPCTCL